MSQSFRILYVYIALSFIYLGFFSTEAFSQFSRTSYPYFTQHFIHAFSINPAFVGDPNQPSIGAAYRGAPRRNVTTGNSGFVYVKGMVPALNDGGIGLTFSYNNDEFRETYDRQMHLGLTAAYTFNLADLIELKGGVAVGLLRSNSNNFFGRSPGLANNERKQKLNVDIGIMIDIPYAKIGVAMHHNNQPEFDFYQNISPTRFQNELFFTIDGDIPIQDIISIKPSIIAQMESRDMLTQYTLMGEYDDMVFAGVSFSKEIEFNRNQVTIGGLPVSRLEDYHPLRLTLGGKVAKFLVAGTYGFPNQEGRNALFEISLGYFLNDEDDY